MHSLVAVQRRNHTWQGPLADRPCRPPPVPDRRHAARRAARRHVLRNSAVLRQLAGRVGKTRREADRSRRGEGDPLCQASVLLQGHGAAPGAVAPLAGCGRTPSSAPEDQTDQQHFSFRLRLCGRRAWLARQWMLPRAAPESGTRGRISALPCLATPMSQYACCASLLLRTSTATQRAFSRWPAGRGGPGARAAVAVAAMVAATLCAPSLASARLHRRGAGVELGIAGRPEER